MPALLAQIAAKAIIFIATNLSLSWLIAGMGFRLAVSIQDAKLRKLTHIEQEDMLLQDAHISESA